ncbi:MATE family efflux transporter [Roseateles violae]|uniref:MATE family efflux transporter n=1 Tax=Roseateles violae TaxID=3058042 RepID=A0ABT8DT83_9BURK|nr:MATE family efflux transporter [Pelomonas sp. PFR6]MDN3921276.1 MATE family efflux transporter [Pelomonas sp. PFR6]
MSSAATAAPSSAATLDPRTRLLLEGPIAATLLRLAAPNVLVMGAQAGVGLIETFFIGKLGTEALAGMALVFPVVMLMQMMSAGAFGGGMASAVARALGARRQRDADALVFHALAIAAVLGLAFMAAALLGGRWLYARLGGSGAALEAALQYSDWVFAGALLVWIFNALAALIRGSGNMNLPAAVTVIGSLALVPLSPLLIFGWGPLPGLGIAGGALALLLYYAAGTVALGLHMLSGRSLLKPRWRELQWRLPLFADILRVGVVGAISTLATNLAIAISTALVAGFGAAAIAGYGTASRLEYLLVPLVFGFGAPLVSMVGTCVGAGQRERALRVAWIGAGLSAALTEAIGLAAALFPRAWLSLFDSDPAMLDAGTRYLQIVGPVYGFFGLALSLYFASQGAGRLLWPIIGNLARLLVAALGGWLALRAGWGLAAVFAAQALALIVYGLVNAIAIARGAWFGPLGTARAAAAPRPAP